MAKSDILCIVFIVFPVIVLFCMGAVSTQRCFEERRYRDSPVVTVTLLDTGNIIYTGKRACLTVLRKGLYLYYDEGDKCGKWSGVVKGGFTINERGGGT